MPPMQQWQGDRAGPQIMSTTLALRAGGSGRLRYTANCSGDGFKLEQVRVMAFEDHCQTFGRLKAFEADAVGIKATYDLMASALALRQDFYGAGIGDFLYVILLFLIFDK